MRGKIMRVIDHALSEGYCLSSKVENGSITLELSKGEHSMTCKYLVDAGYDFDKLLVQVESFFVECVLKRVGENEL